MRNLGFSGGSAISLFPSPLDRLSVRNTGEIILDSAADNELLGILILRFGVTADAGIAQVVNDGVIRTIGVRDPTALTDGISAASRRSLSAGTSTGPTLGLLEIVNNGTIDVTNVGIRNDALGDRSVTNTGIIMAGRVGTSLSYSFVFPPSENPRIRGRLANPIEKLTSFTNGAAGVISVGDLSTVADRVGVGVLGGSPSIINDGAIRVQSLNQATGIQVGTVADDRQITGRVNVTNSGLIEATGDGATGILIERVHVTENDVFNTQISSSGRISGLGANSDALRFTHIAASGVSAALADRSRTDLNFSAASIVTGGSGTGAAIRFIGGERHSVVNAGLITAASGNAIVGGTAAETADNSGRIEGSIALAGGDDAVTMRAGAVQVGALDGGTGNDALLFDIASGEASATGAITNFESVRKTGAGMLTLRDTGTIGSFSFLAGTLFAEGNLGASAIAAPSGTTFGGSGSVGAVTIADGSTITPGGSGVATLTMASLALSGTSRLRFDLGAPGQVGGADNDLINVTGNLTLDGLLDVNPRAAFGIGVYRLINYGGALTDNGLTIGNAPAASYTVQTSMAGQVNLVVGAVDDLSIQFWDDGDTSPDGVVDGGVGTWTGGRTNWTNVGGTANNAWAGNFAVFQTAGGAITVEGQQGIIGMQFMANGYRLAAGTGGTLSLSVAETIIRVDPGISAELALPLIGNGALVKRDTGTLILSGVNTYAGGTVIREGVLQVAGDTSLGAASSGVTLDGGILRFASAGSSARGFTILAGGGTIDHANALTLSGAIGGSGAFTKTGAGTLTLSGNSSAFTGATNINGGILNLTGSLGGTLAIGNGARLGGNGTLGNLVVASGGILAPGTSPGTLNATGNVDFPFGLALRSGAGGGAAQPICSRATGMATIEGGTVRVATLDPETQYVDGTRYTFLTAAGGPDRHVRRADRSSAPSSTSSWVMTPTARS